MADYTVITLDQGFVYHLNYGMKAVLLATSLLPPQVDSTGVIAGRVFDKDIPVSKRVSCYDRSNGKLVAQVWSDDNGDYEFKKLPNDNRYYYIVSTDGNGSNTYYNAVAQDLLQAV